MTEKHTHTQSTYISTNIIAHIFSKYNKYECLSTYDLIFFFFYVWSIITKFHQFLTFTYMRSSEGTSVDISAMSFTCFLAIGSEKMVKLTCMLLCSDKHGNACIKVNYLHHFSFCTKT